MSNRLVKLNLQLFAEGEEPKQQFDVDNFMNQLNQTLDDKLGGLEAKLNTQQEQPMTEEQREELNYKLREQFDDDPLAFTEKIRTEAEQNALKQFEEKYGAKMQQFDNLSNKLAWQDQVRGFMNANPNANGYMSQMSQILQENPALMNTKDPLGTAYKIATSNDIAGNGGNVVDNMLNSETYKSQLLNNENLRREIINDYQARLNGQSPAVPPIMGNSTGGTGISASSGEQPKTLAEARMAALRRIQGI